MEKIKKNGKIFYKYSLEEIEKGAQKGLSAVARLAETVNGKTKAEFKNFSKK